MERDEREELLRSLPNKQRMFYHQISEIMAESILDWEDGTLSDGQHEKWVKLITDCVGSPHRPSMGHKPAPGWAPRPTICSEQ
jgi:hypothetical protein